MKTVSVIVGATAGLGRALAEELARQGHDLYLTATDEMDLSALAADLRIRHEVAVEFRVYDILHCAEFPLSEQVLASYTKVDNLFLIAGYSDLSATGPVDNVRLQKLLQVNFVAPVSIINDFLPHMADNEAANIVGAGSIATCRGRRNNALYAAAKRGLEFYFDTTRHWLADGHACKLQFYRLGYLKTRMTFGQRLPFPALDPELAAQQIVRNLGKDLGSVYLPKWWHLIALILQCVPWPIFRKLDI